ncbi:TadE/TadG family type IV pilus assembly protein [Zobellella maritima]|uniref:TadE/TadG family type IV pilus assembly protein n=1 Tax=Zobellella maritima TaxID=2059725 RepID=UPI001E50893C|nr:TadE/TadG family type IV pilus assembly protein [Zobellella maritima]
MPKITLYHRQRGAVAIEFAALFLVFFMVLYGIIAYSIPLLLELSFQQVSADAGRIAYRVDPARSQADYIKVVGGEVNKVVENSWLPESWRQGDCPVPAAASEYNWQSLPATASGDSYGHIALDNSDMLDPRYLLHTCIQRGYNQNGDAEDRAIIPIISLAGARIPSLPQDEQGKTIIKGETITRL